MSDAKMKKAVKKRWIAALRSGKYRQGKAYLCKTYKGRSKFCCLGVLAHEELDGEWQELGEVGEGNTAWNLYYKGDEALGLLPKEALIEVGLSDIDQDELSGMNERGRSFKEIADWIEENL